MLLITWLYDSFDRWNVIGKSSSNVCVMCAICKEFGNTIGLFDVMTHKIATTKKG